MIDLNLNGQQISNLVEFMQVRYEVLKFLDNTSVDFQVTFKSYSDNLLRPTDIALKGSKLPTQGDDLIRLRSCNWQYVLNKYSDNAIELNALVDRIYEDCEDRNQDFLSELYDLDDDSEVEDD